MHPVPRIDGPIFGSALAHDARIGVAVPIHSPAQNVGAVLEELEIAVILVVLVAHRQILGFTPSHGVLRPGARSDLAQISPGRWQRRHETQTPCPSAHGGYAHRAGVGGGFD